MKKAKKWLFVSFVIMSLCIPCLQPLTVHAEETNQVTGGANNTVFISSTYKSEDGSKQIIEQTLTLNDNWEIVGVVINTTNGVDVLYKTIVLNAVRNGEYRNIRADNIAYVSGSKSFYNSSGTLISVQEYTVNDFESFFYYKNVSTKASISCECNNIKLFDGYDAFYAYAESGSLDGMITQPADIDNGIKDTSIGYLHGLKHKALQYGEVDENGIPSSFDDYFTWDNTYPEYDDSYLVEVRASCEVEVKKWFGIGKSTIYNSDIREIQQGIPYKDLSWTISLQEQKAIFNDFITEYMPGNDSVSDVISAGTYQFDAYYFRVYKWDDELGNYKYGMWVRIDKHGTALDGSLETTTDAGDFDDDGNWVQDPGSDYGTGEDDSTIVGSGEDQESAKDEADQKQEIENSGDTGIDFSDANLMKIWEWFTGNLISLFKSIGVIPDFFSKLFSFLPSPIITFIGIGIVIAIILRFLGR